MPDLDISPDDTPSGRTARQGTEDDEQALWLSEALKGSVRYDHTSKRWHIWNGTIWAPDKTRQVQRMVMDLARERLYAVADGTVRASDREVKHLLKLYRKVLDVTAADRALTALSTRKGYGTDGSDWDQQPELLGCSNGIVDLTQNALVEDPGPELLVSQTTGHKFVPFDPETQSFSDRCPVLWRSMLEWTSNDQELAVFYLLWFGYSLFGHTAEQRFLILTGLGRNGKGALVTAMRHVFGDYSASADANLYMRTRWGSARSDGARADLMALKGKRLAVMSEPDGGVFNEEMLKAHTGGDPITARALNSNNVISWTPTHTITFLTNKPPRVDDIGPAMAARVMVADFRERFDGPNENKRLYKELEAEAEGTLAVLCWAAKLWYDSANGLSLPERVRQASQEYLTSNDPIGRALGEAFEVGPGLSATARKLHDAYTDWHARSDEEGDPLTLTAFGLLLARRGFTKRRTEAGVVYSNIRPLSAVELADGDG